MSKQAIVTDKAPAAIGPYSQAIKAGDYVFFSGQVPLDPTSGELVAGGIAAQTEQVMSNLQAMLIAADLDVDAVVKTTIYLTDMDAFPIVNDIYARTFTGTAPARATVGVAALPKGALVEMEWVAYAGR